MRAGEGREVWQMRERDKGTVCDELRRGCRKEGDRQRRRSGATLDREERRRGKGRRGRKRREDRGREKRRGES